MIKASDERAGKKRTGEMFEDLLSSVMDSLNFNPEERQALGIEVAAQPQRQSSPDILPPKPKKFRCSCGTIVDVKSPADLEVECPGCHTLYDLSSYQQPGPAAPPAAAPVIAAEPERGEE